MSTLTTTAQRVPTKLIALALALTLAAAALTTVLIASKGSGSAATHASRSAAAQRQLHGGPAEGRQLRSQAPVNDGSDHSGRRP
jgi:hypothetical protein